FNLLWKVVWYRKIISIEAKLRIFRACVLSVLLYGSETWTLTMAEERRLHTFYMRWLRTIIGVTLGDRMTNEMVLDLTGQPSLDHIMRRNRLRRLEHFNRMDDERITKKIMFSYFANSRRPPFGVNKRWWDK